MASVLLLLQPLSPNLSSPTALPFSRNSLHVPFLLKPSSPTKRAALPKRLMLQFALTESDAPKSLDPPNPQYLLQELAVILASCLQTLILINVLIFRRIILGSFPVIFGWMCVKKPKLCLLSEASFCNVVWFSSLDIYKVLVNHLWGFMKLNDAAFDLSNGPVVEECGKELGEVLLNLSRAWELADTSASLALVTKLPLLGSTLPESAKFAFGKRLLSAGRRFQSMGQYGQGELQRIARAMTAAGKLLSAELESTETDKQPMMETRMLKFGELQVEVTPEKANIGAVIGLIFGVLSWQLGQGIQSIPDSSMQYANENALMLAKSLRVAMLVLFYSSTVLSTVASIGLLLLGRQLQSKAK